MEESPPNPADRSRRKREADRDDAEKSRRRKEKAEDGKTKSHIRPKGSGVPGSAKSGSTSWSLGKTEGVIAAGAWAARAEVANLLEDGIEIDTLLYLIRKGCEGNHKLALDGTLEDLESEESVAEKAPSSRTTPSPPPGEASTREVLGDMSDEDWNVALAKQKSILESLSGGERPPWAKEASKSAAAGSLFPLEPVVTFVKSSKPPPSGVKMERRHPENVKPFEAKDDKEDVVEFRKPVKTDPPPKPPYPAKVDRRGGSKGAAYGMQAKELAELEEFHEAALAIYYGLKELGIKMDLSDLVEPSGSMDDERFRLHSRPNKAATGLNYVRLMKGLLRSVERSSEMPVAEGVATTRLQLVEYIEQLIQNESGFLTPRSLLYAVEFFSKAFGFGVGGPNWDRCKRLSLRYAQTKPAGTNRAEPFYRETMLALENITMDPFVARPKRVACGKLRLCIQASIRFDDLLNTPLGCCEWGAQTRGERDQWS